MQTKLKEHNRAHIHVDPKVTCVWQIKYKWLLCVALMTHPSSVFVKHRRFTKVRALRLHGDAESRIGDESGESWSCSGTWTSSETREQQRNCCGVFGMCIQSRGLAPCVLKRQIPAKSSLGRRKTRFMNFRLVYNMCCLGWSRPITRGWSQIRTQVV